MKSTTLAATAVLLGLTSAADVQPVRYTSYASGLVISDVGPVVSVTGGLQPPTLNTTNAAAGGTLRGQAALGIDTQECAGYILAGIQWDHTWNETKYSAFAQWGDSAPVILDLEIGPTDHIDLEVQSHGDGSGTATVINAQRGTNVVHNFTGEANQLCHQSASWLVIDPSVAGDGGAPYAAFADFEEIDFIFPTYYVQGDGSIGNAVRMGQGEIWELEQDGKVVATTRIESVPNDTNTVTVIYNDGE